MNYKSHEVYSFSVPSEYKAYSDFKEKLDEAKVKYSIFNGVSFVDVEIRNHASFDITDTDVWELRETQL